MNLNKMIIFISIFLLFAGVFSITTGIHNIDNAWNMKYIKTNYNIDLCDNNTINQRLNSNQTYTSGLILTFIGTAILSLSIAISIAWRQN